MLSVVALLLLYMCCVGSFEHRGNHANRLLASPESFLYQLCPSFSCLSLSCYCNFAHGSPKNICRMGIRQMLFGMPMLAAPDAHTCSPSENTTIHAGLGIIRPSSAFLPAFHAWPLFVSVPLCVCDSDSLCLSVSVPLCVCDSDSLCLSVSVPLCVSDSVSLCWRDI